MQLCWNTNTRLTGICGRLDHYNLLSAWDLDRRGRDSRVAVANALVGMLFGPCIIIVFFICGVHSSSALQRSHEGWITGE